MPISEFVHARPQRMHCLQWCMSGMLLLGAAACAHAETVSPGPTDAVPQARLDRAVSELDGLATSLMQRSGIPGMAMAVVQNERVLYAKGFGLRAVGSSQNVDADTVFQLASMSKPIGATVIAQQVGVGRVKWDTPMRELLPWFALSDPYVSRHVTIGDLYSHRSGLPESAGETLEELGYSREQIMRGLARLPLAPFRSSYFYTNAGMTSAASAVAEAAGTDWATLSEQALYKPLGMKSTSSRFADFRARSNRAFGHVKVDGAFVVGPELGPVAGRMVWSAYNTDRLSPTGGVSSSANDMARWMSFVLATASGKTARMGGLQVPASALLPALTPKSITREAVEPGQRPGHYGYGFNVSTLPTGRPVISHSGAFAWGASTNFALLPSAGIGIVVLTNAWPAGVPEALIASFCDLLEGAPARDWFAIYSPAMSSMQSPKGELAGRQRPAQPAPPQSLDVYIGSYSNDYHGMAYVTRNERGGLELRLGEGAHRVFVLEHWAGDVFTFPPINDNVGPGSISKAVFARDGKLTLEHYNQDGVGVFVRAASR